MMEEVSVMMAYDAHVMEQMSEEEILACLVAETGPKFTKAEMRESRLQIMEDEEDPLDKYLRENQRLQQASHRLEQENDTLAHRLIISKVALRNALNKAEDRVDELTKDLLETRHRLQAAEERKARKEEEAAVLKAVFQRELEKAEQEVRRSSGVIADYKQICSQLTNRLERLQAAHRQEVDSLKSAAEACSRCRHVAETDEPAQRSPTAAPEDHRMTDPGRGEDSEGPVKAEHRRDDQEKESLRAHVRELEQDLAQTKLQMVEAKCKIQELEHQRGILANDLQEAKSNSWISKAFTSLRTSNSLSIPRDGAPTEGWSSKKLSWPHRENRGSV